MEFLSVQTQGDLERYCNIWLPQWIDSGYELESYITEGIERTIFHSSKTKEDIGCCEFNPYFFENSPVNETFPFNNFTVLKGKKVVEIDKLVIKDEFKGSVKSLMEILNFLTIHLIEKKYDYLIALLNPELYNVFVWRFKIPITRLISNNNEDSKYIPAMLSIEALEKSNFGQRVMKKYIANKNTNLITI